MRRSPRRVGTPEWVNSRPRRTLLRDFAQRPARFPRSGPPPRTAAVLADRVGDRGPVAARRPCPGRPAITTGTDDPPGADFACALATATDTSTLGTDAAQREWTIGFAWPGAIARLQVDGLLDQAAVPFPSPSAQLIPGRRLRSASPPRSAGIRARPVPRTQRRRYRASPGLRTGRRREVPVPRAPPHG